MSIIDKRLCKGTISDSLSDLYQVPVSKKTLVKSLILCNITSASADVTLKIAGTNVLYTYSIDSGKNYAVPAIDVFMETGEKIEAVSSVALSVDYIICGREIDV